MDNTADITSLIQDWNTGDQKSRHRLVAELYKLMKISASRRLANSSLKQQIQTTELVSEVFIKLDKQHSLGENRGQFFLLLATVIRRVLVDMERRHLSAKRGGRNYFLELDENKIQAPLEYPDWLTLDAKLRDFESLHPKAADIVAMRILCGLSVDETAHAANISRRSVFRKWHFARTWLHKELADLNSPG